MLLLASIGLVYGLAAFAQPVHAQTVVTPPPTAASVSCGMITSGAPIGTTITTILCIANRYVTVIAVFIMIVVGIMYILGGFKPDMASTAKTIFGTTVTGLIFMYLISFIINILLAGGILTKS